MDGNSSSFHPHCRRWRPNQRSRLPGVCATSCSRAFWVVETLSLRPGAKAEVRRNRYKVAVDAEKGRRRKEDNMVEIRNSKRKESLFKSAKNLFNNSSNSWCLFKPPLWRKSISHIMVCFPVR